MVVVGTLIVVGLVVVAIALVAVGKVTAEFADAPPRSLFVFEEAVFFVAGRLREETTASLSYDDVRALLGFWIEQLETAGVATAVGDDVARAGPLVADDDDALAVVIGRADAVGLDVTDTQVAEVLAAANDYLVAIGAVGPVA